MRHKFIVKGEYKDLMLFFAGWGMDENPFMHHRDECISQGYDFCVCYDYSDMNLDVSILEGYENIMVRAWSMGVYAAAFSLQGKELSIAESVALNGTIYPVADETGIPEATFRATLEGLSEKSLEKFNWRMCGGKTQLEEFLKHPPGRGIASLREELESIGIHSSANPAPSLFRWDKALIGESDLIFPTSCQLKAWDGIPHEVLPIAHYHCTIPFTELINERDKQRQYNP